jgi:hypothetical protein
MPGQLFPSHAKHTHYVRFFSKGNWSDSLAGCSKWFSNEAAGEKKPEAYPLGYVEDFFEPRTKLGAIFSIP